MIYEYVTENSWLGISASVDSTDDIVVDTGSDIVYMPVAEVPNAMSALAVAAGIEPLHKIVGREPENDENLGLAVGYLQRYLRNKEKAEREALENAEREAEALELAELMMCESFECDETEWDKLSEGPRDFWISCAKTALRHIKKKDEK